MKIYCRDPPLTPTPTIPLFHKVSLFILSHSWDVPVLINACLFILHVEVMYTSSAGKRVPRTQVAHIILSPDTVQRELGTHFQNHCFCWGERNTFYLKHKRICFLYLPKRVGWRVRFISMLNRIQSKL